MSVSPPIELVGWALDLLRLGGWPTTTENLTAVVAWARAEGGHNVNNAAWNPLNTTKPMPGAGNTGSQGNIKVYVSRAQGLEATVATIRLNYYTAVVAALRAGNNAVAVCTAVGASPWGTHAHTSAGAGCVDLIPSARRQVAASGSGSSGGGSGGAFGTLGDAVAGALAGAFGTSSSTPGSIAAHTSAGGALAGPAPDRNLPSLPAVGVGLANVQLTGKGLWADVEDAVIAGRLSTSSSETTLLELTLEDPGHMILASRVLDADTFVLWGDLTVQLATLEATAGSSGRGGLVAGFSAADVNTLRERKGPILLANTSTSELVAVMAHTVGLKVVAQQTHQRAALWVLGYRPDPPKTVDPVTGEETTDPNAAAGQEAETWWDAIARFAKEEGFLAFECAGVLYYGKPSWLIKTLPVRAVAYDPVGDNGTRGLLACTARRTYPETTGAIATVELSLTLDAELLGDGRGWLPGTALELTGLPTFDGRYMVTALDVDVVAGTAELTAATPIDPPAEGPPDPPNTGQDGAVDTSIDPDATASPVGSPSANAGGWFHPLAGKGKWGHDFAEKGHTGADGKPHTHAGVDITVAVGTPVYAAKAGRLVSYEGGHGGYGNLISIDHAGGFQTRYAHVSRFARHVKGDEVRAGELIGYSGGKRGAAGAGNSTGPHLHFEVRLNGKAVNPDTYYPGQ